MSMLFLAGLPVWAGEEVLTVLNTPSGSTPAALGYNLAHFRSASNAADWFRYSGVNAARVFISPSDIEPSDDLAPEGDGVDSSASFFARKALVRAQSSAPNTELLETYIKWSAFSARYNRVLSGSNRIELSYALGELRDRQVSVIATITAGESHFPITSSDDWAGKWELWQHYYAQAFLLSRDYGVGSFSMYNEPNGIYGIEGAEWLQRYYYCSDAIQSAIADMNTRYGKNIKARVFAPNTANGVEKYNTAPSNTWGRDAVTQRHLRLDGTSSPTWMNLQVYNYQKYSMRTHADASLTGYITDYDALRSAINADMVGEPQLPIALTEFNVRTAADYEGKDNTQDSPSDYSALGANCIALSSRGAHQLYLFKFGQTASNASSGIAKNGTHYVQNASTTPYNYGGATKAAEVYRLFVKASGSSRNRLKTTATAGALPSTTAGLWSQVTYAPDKGSYFIYLVNKGASPVSLKINLSALNLPDGNPVFIEEVSGSASGGTMEQTTLGAGVVPALPIPAYGVRLYTIPAARQYTVTTAAVADATLADGVNSSTINGTAATLPIRADGTANGRRVAIIKTAIPAVDPTLIHTHWLALRVATASGSAPIQAHIYGITDNGWTEATARWSGFGGMLKQNIGNGNLIENNVLEGHGSTIRLLGQVVASSTTATTRLVDVTDFIKSRADGFASFIIVQEHRWDVSQPALGSGDTQSVGLIINSREAATGAPALHTITRGTAPAILTQPQAQTIPEGRPVTLSVAASGSIPITYIWLKNNAVIPDANGESLTIASFKQADAGEYSVTITNYAGSLTSQSAVLSFLGNGLFAFRKANGLAADGTQDLNAAGDGVQYLLKYAFNMIGVGAGQAPTLAAPNAAILEPTGNAGLPRISTDGTGRLAISFVRRKPALNPGIVYSVEFSVNLKDWAVNADASESVTSLDPAVERVTITDSSPVPTWSRRFVRVRVNTP